MVLKVYLKTLLIALFCATENRVFDNFILDYESFEKVLQSFETCVLVNNTSCGILFSSLESPPTTFNESFNVTLVPFYIPDFNILR